MSKDKLLEANEVIRNCCADSLKLNDIIKELILKEFPLALIIKSLYESGFSTLMIDEAMKTVKIPEHLNRSFNDLFFDFVELE